MVGEQCDQMARFFVQSVAIYNNENLQKKQKYFFNVVSKFYRLRNNFSKIAKYFENLAKVA